MTIGIYCIENISNNKKYIGKSLEIETRIKAHKRLLNRGMHENIHLQRAWNKNGKNSFLFYILEECSEKILPKKERYYILTLRTKSHGYNLTDGGEGCPGRIISNDTRKKMSDSKKGIKRKPFTDETINKMKEASKNRKNVSKETREKMSNSAKKRPPISEETRKKLKNRRHTQQYKDELSARTIKYWRKWREENSK